MAIDYAFFQTIYIICNFIASFCNEFLLLETILAYGNYSCFKLKKNENEISELSNVKNNFCCKIESSNINLNFLNSNKLSLNNIYKENNNMIIRNVNQNIGIQFKKENQSQKENSEIKKENSYNKAINFKNNKKPLYRLLFYQILNCILPEKAKTEYKIDYMNRKAIQKKLDIYNYLNLLKRVDMLFVQIQIYNMKNKNSMMDFIS